MVSLFFSYSHRDEGLRDELETHLAALKRQGVIEAWHDRRIDAGSDLGNEISEHLENANIILLLISPYFIASDYCYEIEMRRAMERHDSGEARVIPVILHPCDWHGLPFGNLQATPPDGKPVSKFPNQHDAFLEVTKAIRRVSGKPARTPEPAGKNPNISVQQEEDTESITRKAKRDTRSSNLRVKREFTDRDKDQFLEEAYSYIVNYFEESLAELDNRNTDIETRFKKIDANHFSAYIYSGGSLASSCQIWLGDRRGLPSGIAYSQSENRNDNSMNESLSVDDDGYTLFLKPLGMFMRGPGHEQLTYEGGAEYYWSKLIEPLQR